MIPSVTKVSAPLPGAKALSAPTLLQRHLRPIYNTKELQMWSSAGHNTASDTALSSWFNDSVFDVLAANEARWLQRMRMGQHETPPWGQAFMTWWATYNKTHPEFFALQPDGHRGPVLASEPDRVKMCVSNPHLHAAIAAGGTAHDHFGCVPRAPQISISAWVFCMSWCAELEFRVMHTECLQRRTTRTLATALAANVRPGTPRA